MPIHEMMKGSEALRWLRKEDVDNEAEATIRGAGQDLCVDLVRHTTSTPHMLDVLKYLFEFVRDWVAALPPSQPRPLTHVRRKFFANEPGAVCDRVPQSLNQAGGAAAIAGRDEKLIGEALGGELLEHVLILSHAKDKC